MAQVLRSLENIPSLYTVFEQDQVLTHLQLNRLVEYLDDQERLTRVELLGVGIVCGLRATLSGDKVILSRGVGVTTDGDLLRVPADGVYSAFKRYDETAPAYPPFRPQGGAALTLYELVADGTSDAAANGLGEFTARANRPLTDMSAVLLMESTVKDKDLCTSTDCDNLGQTSKNELKLLLVERTAAPLLEETVVTADRAARALDEVVAERPLLSAVTAADALASPYRAACTTTHTALVKALKKLYPACAPFLSEVFPSDPTPGWIAILNTIQSSFAASTTGIQYYYDFLKDLVETYSAIRERLFGDVSVCGPDLGAFPKHLLLGPLATTTPGAFGRTGFYPSPMVSATRSRLPQVRFLAAKLGAQIESFKIPAGPTQIRITPSCFEDRSLEDRAIPYYYDPAHATAIHTRWNHGLTVRNMSAYNYSYHADRYSARGGAARPLTSQLGRYGFFRVEGHLGANVTAAVTAIETEIKSKNLPFVVRAVHLGVERGKVTVKPPRRWTDLHRFHRLVRTSLSHQVEQAAEYAGTLKGRVDTEVHDEIVVNPQTLKGVAASNTTAAKTAGQHAATALSKPYSDFRMDPSWKQHVTQMLTASGALRVEVGEVAKTEVTTPIDWVVGSPHVHWVDWLDELIVSREQKQDERLLFSKFFAEHPGLEHFAGVVRGGTFVLVYDATNTVIADFMLPYVCCAEVEEEDEPPLTKPPPAVPWLPSRGIRFVPTREVFFNKEIEPKIQFQKAIQTDYFNIFKGSVELIGKTFTRPELIQPGGAIIDVQDDFIRNRLLGLQFKSDEVMSLRQRILDPAVTPQVRASYEALLKQAEIELASAAAVTARHVEATGMPVAAGSDGFRMIGATKDAVDKLQEPEALNLAKTEFTRIRETTARPEVRDIIGRFKLPGS